MLNKTAVLLSIFADELKEFYCNYLVKNHYLCLLSVNRNENIHSLL